MRTLFLLIACSVGASAQVATSFSPYATPFVPFSAEAQAVGEAGAFGQTSDPLRMLDNPAVLADFAGGVSISGDRIPDWLSVGSVSTRAFAMAGGVRSSIAGMPASVGAGLTYGSFDASPYPVTEVDLLTLTVVDGEEFDPGRDETVALGLGAAVDGPVRVRAGASLRRYSSAEFHRARAGSERAKALTADLGVDVTAPLGRWIMPTPDGGFRLVTDLSLGYALRGIGLSESDLVFDPEVFGIGAFSGAVGRSPSAGLSLLVGFDAGLGTRWAFRGASVEFLTGAEARGANVWGGISAENVLLGVGDEGDQILTRRGYRLALAEVLTLSRGSMRGANFGERASWGATVSAGGALRLAGMLGAGEALHPLGRRLDLRYAYARFTFDGEGSPFGTTVAHGLTLRLTP